MCRPTLNVSSIGHWDISAQGIVNGRLVTEFATGTLVCEAADLGAGDDLTVTKFGRRFYDSGVLTERQT